MISSPDPYVDMKPAETSQPEWAEPKHKDKGRPDLSWVTFRERIKLLKGTVRLEITPPPVSTFLKCSLEELLSVYQLHRRE